MKHFKNIASLEDLKKQFRALAMENHPDKGGDVEVMKQINNEYDQLFPIWKTRSKIETSETAETSRREFYTQNGWAGKNYSISLGTKEITAIIRNYVKEVYSDCKFSVTCKYYSGGSSISVRLMEAPTDIFQDARETKDFQINEYYIDKSTEGFNLEIKTMLKDIIDLINSYRFSDSDSMIDYFHTNFYYSVSIGSWDKSFQVVKREKKTKKQNQPTKEDVEKATDEKNGTNYTISKDQHTQTLDEIYVVKFIEKFSKDDYIKLAQQMKSIGGYYSKFKKGFIFKTNPKEALEKMFSEKNLMIA